MMKKSRSSTEQVQNAVGRYLQKRRYSSHDAYRRNSLSTNQSPLQLALKEVLDIETSTNGAIEFSCPVPEPIQIDQQYSKFKVWISESPDRYKPELAQLLYPLFTHLYLELVNNGQKAIAQKFHKRHQSTFLGNAEFKSFILQLTPVCTPEDIAKDSVISSYYESKYTVTLSHVTFQYLMKYLESSNGQPVVLLHVLRSRVDLKIADALGACSKQEAVNKVKNETPCPVELADPEDDCTAEDMQKLEETITSVRNGPTPLSSTCIYRIGNDQNSVTCSAVSSDARRLVCGDEGSTVHLWNLLPDEESSRVDSTHAQISLACDRFGSSDRLGSSASFSMSTSSSARVLRGHHGPVYDVAFVPGTDYLVTCSEDTSMRVWDGATASNKAVYRGHAYPVWCLDVDRMGLSVVTGSMDRSAKLWDLEYTFPLRIYAGHEADVDVVRFHPNGNYVATGSVDKTVRMWSHADAKMVRVFAGHRSGIYALAFSPDGKFLASAGEDRKIRVWDISTSGIVKELKGHSETVYSLVWSPDSSLLSSGGMDGSVRIWDVKGPIRADGSVENGVTNTAASHCSPEMVAMYNTGCANILDLCYSHHHNLIATGLMPDSVSGAQTVIKEEKM